MSLTVRQLKLFTKTVGDRIRRENAMSAAARASRRR